MCIRTTVVTLHDLAILANGILSRKLLVVAFRPSFSSVRKEYLKEVWRLHHIEVRRALCTKKGLALSSSFASGCPAKLSSFMSGGSSHDLPPSTFDDHVAIVQLLSNVFPTFVVFAARLYYFVKV